MKFPAETWDQAPHNREAFHNVASFLRTAKVTALPHPSLVGGRWREATNGCLPANLNVNGFLNQTHTNAFIVAHKGNLIVENYLGSMQPENLHLSQSVAKSFTGAMAGILIHQGKLNPYALVTTYIPELATTAYAGATVQHLLDMTSGVAFDEDYANPYSDIGRVDVASGWKPAPQNADPNFIWPKSILEVILSLQNKEAEHGERFSYRSIETDVLALALERATHTRLPLLLSRLIWRKAGMQNDANYTIDAEGFAIADGGLNACARDYARFGQLILEGGRDIIPATWIEETRYGKCGNLQGSYASLLPNGGYHNQFWIEDDTNRSLIARGVFGQMIYISWEYDLVIVKLSAWPKFVDIEMECATLSMCHKIGMNLQ